MYSSQTEISIIDNTQHSLLLFHYGFIYIIVGSILCGIGYTCYTKINQLLKDLNEKYDVQLKNNVIDFNIKMDTMEIKYQTYIQKLETQIKRFEGKVHENNNYITDCNIKMDTMKNKTETIVNDFNIKIESLDFQVEHLKNIGKEATAVLSISTDKNIELINNTKKEIDIIKTQIVDMKDTFYRLETQTHTNENYAQNYFKLISNNVSKLQDVLVGYVTKSQLQDVLKTIDELLVNVKDNSKENMNNILNIIQSNRLESTFVFTDIYPNGDVYEGTMFRSDNRRIKHGIGKMTYKNGDVYSGCWKNDTYHGKGKLYSLNDKTLTIGEWTNGGPFPNGKSTSYYIGYATDYDINFATTTELKNGKIFRKVNYNRLESQCIINTKSICNCITYDDNGNVSSLAYPPYPRQHLDIPGESLNLSIGYLYL